jgi:transposase
METFYLGIDVSKGYADFMILNRNKQCVEDSFQLDDTFSGHCLLYESLVDFFDKNPGCLLCAAVESTGGYENNWFNSLVKFQGTLNIQTARLNPLGVSANSRADLKRNITDQISAQNVAEFMIAHAEKITYQQQDALANLRRQWSFIKLLTKQSTQLLNQLESLLYIANPELLTYCQDKIPKWVLRVLEKYPTASNLSRAKAKTLATIPYVSTQRAEKLIADAKNSIASATDKTTGQLITTSVNQIVHIHQTIEAQTKIMAEQCSLDEVDLLKTFNGISDYSAIGLILEIQSIKRFSSAKKLASFFGLHPVFKLSGDGSGGFRMSKKGRKEPRRILFMVAMVAINHNPLIASIYKERLEKGMPKMAAIGYCMHKILRIIYGMLKTNRAFDPEIDRTNRIKDNQRQKKTRKDRSRRYQDYDAKAPVSRRQRKRRKERKESQNDNIIENGIIVSAPNHT